MRPGGAWTGSDAARSAVVLDQYAFWLEAIEGVLTRAGIEVVGKSTNVTAALSLVVELLPDIFVIDSETGDDELDGLTCLRLARERVPQVRCVVLSDRSDPNSVDAALAAGAVAYVTKNAHPDDLAFAVRQSFDHSVYMAAGSPWAASPRQVGGDQSADRLTGRELEILLLVAEGRSNAQLAKMLWVTEQTVKFHLSNVYRKINVSNRTEAARWAQLHGLLQASGEVPISA